MADRRVQNHAGLGRAIAVGQAAFIGTFVVTILDLREECRGRPEALIRYYGSSKWDRWVAVSQLATVPPKRGRVDAVPTTPAASTAMLACVPRADPTLGDEVEIFSARTGWRRAVVGERMECSILDS